jgi:hypothetical protein
LDLGHAARVTPNPRIGEVETPARGVLAVGQGAREIPDVDEFERTCVETLTGD